MASVQYGSLPFAEQIAFFRSKVSIDTDAWTDVYAQEHNQGFMVAGARGEVLTDMRKAIDGFISKGLTLEDFRRDFDQVVAKTGWAYNGGRNWRTRVIYETNLRQSYNAGREAQMADPALRKARPYGLYRHGGSADPRPEHKALDGVVLPLDDPWWDIWSPQNGWGCKCKKFTVSEDDIESLGLTKLDKAPETEWEDRLIGARGDNPRTVRVPKGIDPGFEYAPGARSRLKPLVPRELDGAAPPPVIVRPGDVSPAMPQPKPVKMAPIGPLDKDAYPAMQDEERYAQAFLNALGAGGKSEFVFRDVAGGAIPLGYELFQKRTRGGKIQWKMFKNDRHRYLHVLAETLLDPDEIWETWERYGNDDQLRRRYIRIIPGGELPSGLAVFELVGKAGWRNVTLFQLTDESVKNISKDYDTVADYIEAQRGRGESRARVYARD